MENVECGAACLAMVLAKHGHHAPLVEVRQACGVSRDGASAASILQGAAKFGLMGHLYATEVDELALLTLPVILHWDFRHFLVLEKLADTHAVVMDPASGRRRVDLAQFRASYTGVALAFAPGPEFRKRRSQPPPLRRYTSLALDFLPSLTQVLAASLALQAVGLVLPLGQKILVDRVIVPRQTSWIWGLVVLLVGTALARSALVFARSWIIQNLQLAMDLRLVQGFLSDLLRLPMSFFLQRSSGELVRRVDSNTEIQSLFTDESVTAFLDIMFLLACGALMVAFSASLGLLVILLGLVSVACQWATHRTNANMMSAELAASGGAAAVILESLNALETIKATGTEGVFLRRWADREVASSNAGLRRQFLHLKLSTLTGLLADLGSSAVFLLAGREVLEQRMTLGTFSAFLTLQSLFMAPLGSLLGAYGRFQYLGSHLARLADVTDAEPEPSGGRDPGPLTGAISLTDVTFTYGGGQTPTLSGIDLEVRGGEMIALVGPSGAGKSTLARLLLGMHIPDRGTVRFDGADLRGLDLERLRKRMGVVLQETFLLNDTVWGNLSLNEPGLAREQMLEAARLACIHEALATLPNGYDTVLGENGATLSGGQRQRLALARALASRPAILLLDEATSALDPFTEKQVHRNIAGLGCTRILIAHRMSTVRDADRILVLDQGRVVQSGGYRELQAEPGLFRNLAGA